MTEQSTIFVFSSVTLAIMLIYFCISLYYLRESAPSLRSYGRLSENVDKLPVRTPKTYVPPARF